MTKVNTVRWFVLALLALATFAPSTLARDNPCLSRSVTVCVSKSRGEGRVTYRYEISNPTEREMVMVIIGADWEQGEPQLHRFPKAWKRDSSNHFEFGWTIDRAVASGPNGWVPIVVLFEERSPFALAWVLEDSFEPGVKNGSLTVDVTLEGEDPAYETAPWTIFFGEGDISTGRVRAR